MFGLARTLALLRPDACKRRVRLDTSPTLSARLFPALYRLEHNGWLASSWGPSETNRRARYYRLTSAGRRRLVAETERWQRVSFAMSLALQSSD